VHSFVPRPLRAAALLLLVVVVLVGCQGSAPSSGPSTSAATAVSAATAALAATAAPAATAAAPEATAAVALPTTGAAVSGTVAAATPLATSGALANETGTPMAESTAVSTTAATLEATTAATSTLGSANATPAALGTGTPGATGGVTASGTPSTLPVLGAGINSVTYSATDKGYSGPASFASGWTQLTLNNQGTKSHDLTLVRLAAGKTISDVIMALSQQGPPDWATLYGGVSADPGKSASWLVNPPAGNYVILSFGQTGPNQPPDALQGLLNSVTVTAAPAGAPQPQLPATSATISLVDYNFVITGTLQAGAQYVQITNNGKETHEADFLPLKPGKTIADFNKAMQADMTGTPTPPDQLPFNMSPSVTVSPGVTIYYPVTLAAGDYVLACFIPSVSHGGEPHAALGMVKQVTIK
jgi:hypothetical protein